MFINSYGQIVYDDYLAHHGILGQKWGKRNGPPYPLGASSHSASEKKAGWRDSLKDNSAKSKVAEKKTKSVRASGRRYGDSSSDTKTKKDSNTSEGVKTLLKLGVGILTLNAPLIADSTSRLASYGKSKVNSTMEEKRVSQLKVDKKTGFHLKDHEMSPKEDMKHINPGFKNFDKNTKNNCMLCTTAYELRRRGYDVQAGTSTTGYFKSEVKEWFPKAKIESVYQPTNNKGAEKTKETAKALMGIGGKEKYNQLSNALLKHGDGARGNLMVDWNFKGGGHSMVWENQGGNLVIRDCQTNKTYSKPHQIANLLKQTSGASYARTDNLDFNIKKVKGVLR